LFCAALLAGTALAVRRAGGVRRLDDKFYESRFGWLMPGGIFWKLGRRDGRSRERFWPYLFGLLDGWMYNAGRDRRTRERRRDEL
jgi:hypothetical protein